MDPSCITLIMATFNVKDRIPAAVDTLRSVTPDSPLVIQDGGSTDGTVTWLQEQTDTNLRWASSPDRGIYHAFQKALEQVTTPMVMFLGADDLLREEWRDAVRDIRDTTRIWYADVWMPQKQMRWRGETSVNDLARTNLCQQAVFYPLDILREHPFRLEYPLQADWEFNMWAATRSGRSLQYLPYCVCTFNDEDGSSSVGYDESFNRDYPGLVKKYFGPFAGIRYGLPAALAHYSRRFRRLS